MQVIQKRDIILAVRNRWEEQYAKCSPTYLVGPSGHREMVGTIRDRLTSLNLATCSSFDVNTAIGVDGWAKNECD